MLILTSMLTNKLIYCFGIGLVIGCFMYVINKCLDVMLMIDNYKLKN